MSRKKPRTPQEVPAATPPPHPGASPQPAAREPDPIIFSIRGNQAWREWLRRFAAHRRVTATALIDQVLAETAQREGFVAPPPRHSGASADHNGHPRGQ
jgi:hypothetical protein